MELRLVKSLWGVTPPSTFDGWIELLTRYESEGYHGIEAITLTYLPEYDPNFLPALKSTNLFLLPQIHTSGGYLKEDGNYVYSSSLKVDDHLTSLKDHLDKLNTFVKAGDNPTGVNIPIVNVHSGHDFWSKSEATAFYKTTQTFLPLYPFKIVHETHRQRYLFSPRNYYDLSIPININADLSHWACVCERLFNNECNDEFFINEVLEKLKGKCEMIHARIGHGQGTQIYGGEEWKEEIEEHAKWWDIIWESQRSRNLDFSYVTTEFGPHPYAQHTSESLLDSTNTWMKNFIISRFSKASPPSIPPPLTPPSLLVIPPSLIRSKATFSLALSSASLAFKSLNVSQSPLPLQLKFPERLGETCIKPGHIKDQPYFAVKVASGFQKNKEEGYPTGSGVIMVFDAKTGTPKAVLDDKGYLTDLRTAGAVVLSASALTSSDERTECCVIGCGVMASLIIEMLSSLLKISSFKCWSRTSSNVIKMVDELRDKGINVTPSSTSSEACRGCDLIITTTCATEPIIQGLERYENVTVIAMGSDTPGKRELGDEVMSKAFEEGKVYGDVKGNVMKLGECQYHSNNEGKVMELKDGLERGREGGEFIVVDLTGTGVQDAAIASMVMEAF
ncbi:hypothetical protein TrVE_jg9184 [Triparma verrucosa]|uniref:Uncharacterized protein n=1 Tax=Triparma verrucosa TaxID=1606542 RepID=A0A9W7BZB1_9STRA|nr:hypothetical protein TrVE_jg9184 [Triparma verrucosa]